MSVQIPHAPTCTCSECQTKRQAQPNHVQGKKPKDIDLLYHQFHLQAEYIRGLEKRLRILEESHTQDPKSGRVSHTIIKSGNQPIKAKQGGRSAKGWFLIGIICIVIVWVLYAAFMMATGHKFMLPKL